MKKIYRAIALLLLIFFLREFLGRISFRFFLFLDNLVKVSSSVSPVLMWGFLGLFVGLIYGSFVAWKKYNLAFKLNFISIGVFMSVLLILFISNKPLEPLTQKNIYEHTKKEYTYNTEVWASSSIPANYKISYKATNLLNQDDNTAWIMNRKYSGDNPEITFKFSGIIDDSKKNLKCIGFKIKNGYRKSLQTWSNYGRLKDFSIYRNYNYVQDAVASNKNTQFEEIIIKPIPVMPNDRLSIKINSVYPGKRYPNLIAISELVPILEYSIEN